MYKNDGSVVVKNFMAQNFLGQHFLWLFLLKS